MKLRELTTLNIKISKRGVIVTLSDQDFHNTEYRKLWNLKDYVVTSMVGHTVYLRRRRAVSQIENFEQSLEQELDENQAYGNLINTINEEGSFR
jgi:hypothetical protein